MLFFANSINKACAKGEMAEKADKLAEMYDKKERSQEAENNIFVAHLLLNS